MQQVARSNARLQSVKFKLTDSNASLKAELEQVRREKSNIVDKHARDLKLKEKEMMSRLGEVCREKKKAAEAHVQDLKSKDMQIATIRELHTREIEKLRDQLTVSAKKCQSLRKASNMVCFTASIFSGQLRHLEIIAISF